MNHAIAMLGASAVVHIAAFFAYWIAHEIKPRGEVMKEIAIFFGVASVIGFLIGVGMCIAEARTL